MALLPLAPAATRTRVVAAAPRILGGVPSDDLGRSAVGAKPVRHEPHRGVDVMEERLEASSTGS